MFPCPVLKVYVVLHVCSCLLCVPPWMLIKRLLFEFTPRLLVPRASPLQTLTIVLYAIYFNLLRHLLKGTICKIFVNIQKLLALFQKFQPRIIGNTCLYIHFCNTVIMYLAARFRGSFKVKCPESGAKTHV